MPPRSPFDAPPSEESEAPQSSRRRRIRPRKNVAQAAAGSTSGTQLHAAPSVAALAAEDVARHGISKARSSFLGRHNKNLPLLRRLNWLHVPLLTATPILAIYGIATTPFNLYTYAFAVFWYMFSGLGITAGYHRLFAHQAYEVVYPIKCLLVLMGSAAVEGSVRWWCRDHRAHHRYVDTEKDPYAVTEGFWYAHIGWMLVKQEPGKIGRAAIPDLNADPFIRFQHRFYPLFALVMGFLVPTFACGLLFGDYRGGFFIAGVARLVFVHHSTFLVNSLAHYWGDDANSDLHTARNSVITALLTIGEGYHNFHHEMPSDYRNGVEWYQYDPTKWFIRTLQFLGLAHSLKRFPKNEIEKGVLQMKQKKLNEAKSKLDWGPEPESLPEMTMEEVQVCVEEDGHALIVLDNFVLDVEDFLEDHPGGEKLLSNNFGKDVTAMFYGDVYVHSKAARNLQAMMRVARIAGSEGH